MKALTILWVGVALGTALAQDASTNQPPDSPVPNVQATAEVPSSRVVKSIGPAAPSVPPGRVVVGGAIPKLTQSDEPLQMINPLAPKRYGDGTDVLARNLVTGQAEGVTFLSFTCPEKPASKKSRKAAAAPAAGGK